MIRPRLDLRQHQLAELPPFFTMRTHAMDVMQVSETLFFHRSCNICSHHSNSIAMYPKLWQISRLKELDRFSSIMQGARD